MTKVRKSAPKSRQGCRTCKLRRVKCDETKPRCQRCTSTGRTCDGYTSSLPASPYDSSLGFSALATRTSSISTSLDLQRHRAFDFFRTETVPMISGHFRARTWELVLQACSKEPIVSQAGIALGSLHDVLTVVDVEPGSRALSTSFPSLEYIQALRDLRNYLSSSATIDVNVVLICALIYISIEVIQNNYLNALVHLENSLHLIRASSEIASGSSGPSSPHRQEIDSELIDAFQSLDIHASSFQGMRPPAMTRFHTSDIPGRFSSLKESHLALSGILVKLSSFNRSVVEEYKYRKLQDLPLEAFAETTSITADFDAWDDRFQKFLHRSTSKFSRAGQIIIDILIINHHLGFIEAATCTHTEATIFDQFDAPFDEIVTLAANVIRTRKTSKILDFHLDIGVIQPLYWTAVKCREPWTRQKAMSLLKSINFQEGVWIAAAQVSIAQVAIDRENTFNDSTILSDRPMEFARVHSVGTVIDPVKKTAEVVLSQKLNGLDGPWHEHVGWCSWG